MESNHAELLARFHCVGSDSSSIITLQHSVADRGGCGHEKGGWQDQGLVRNWGFGQYGRPLTLVESEIPKAAW